MSWLTQPDAFGMLVLLAVLEIFLGIDNVVLMSQLTERLGKEKRNLVASFALVITTAIRILLICGLVALMSTFRAPLVGTLTLRHLILLGGGIFLVLKSIQEIQTHLRVQTRHYGGSISNAAIGTLCQIIVLDLLLSGVKLNCRRRQFKFAA
ncbi:MAG TPA: hypothetical protein V6D17_21595 [Candidatus Obscuribacterales bacterium]